MKTKSTQPREGILAGGNWIIDQVKVIDTYPAPEKLANILNERQGTGGAPYNVLVDLAKLGVGFPLYGAGLVGKDALGEHILEDCRQHQIDARHVQMTAQAPTSYTDVMTEVKGGRRTFFHNRGANALWDGKGLDFKKIKARIFHLGYLLLLDALDAPDRKAGTKAAALLAAAQEAGLKTCVDAVSEDSDRFPRIVQPALKHADYAIFNEFEAGKTTGFRIRQADDRIDPVSLRHAAGSMLQMGVRELVVIHFPEGGFARTRRGEDFWQPSLNVPAKGIRGTAGAGDAFCAGVLLGLHEGWELGECLRTAVCAAAMSLTESTCTDGMKPLKTTMELAKKHRFGPPIDPRE
jgi:sugar/nucleoside kinase (ribokinase family)